MINVLCRRVQLKRTMESSVIAIKDIGLWAYGVAFTDALYLPTCLAQLVLDSALGFDREVSSSIPCRSQFRILISK